MTIDYNELKKGGFLRQKQKDKYIARFRTIAGNITSEQMKALAGLAEKYGKGYIHFTTRQGAEIPWVDLRNYDVIRQEAGAAGLLPGTCGPRIRTIVACPGNEVCSFGLMNSREMAGKLDERFFGREVPIKSKIGISGCPNSCSKPQENDIGFVGAVKPVLNRERCIGCGLCIKVCPGKALSMENGFPHLDEIKCIYEGNCIASCPVNAWEEADRGYDVYVGGKIGRFPQLGHKIAGLIPEDEVLQMAEKILLVFEQKGENGERIANTINRIGVEAFKEAVIK